MKRTRSGRRYGGYGSSIIPFIGRYLTSGNSSRRVRRRLGTSRTQTTIQRRSARRGTSGQGVTVQHDARMIYRKKSMPRRRRQRWKAFKNKVNAVAEKDFGSRTVVFNKAMDFTNATNGFQCLGHVTLYSLTSTDSWNNDLNNLSALENFANPTAAQGITVDNSTKLLFQSAVLDVTIRNDSGVCSVVGSYGPDYRGKMEVDVYECTIRKDTYDTGSAKVNFPDLLDQNSVSTKAIGGAGTEIDIQRRGVTPWDTTYSLGRYGIKILSKRKYFISNQETITYQVRDPKRRVTTIKGLSDESGFNKPGWTKAIFIVGKLVPGLTVGAATIGNWQEKLVVGATRKYLYKFEGANEDRTNYQNI